MKISSQLLEKYFKGLCTDEEAAMVSAYLEHENTPELDAYFIEMSKAAEEGPVSVVPVKVAFIRRLMHPAYGIAAAVILLLSVLAWLWQLPRQKGSVKVAALSDTIFNNNNTIRLVHMSDGSKVWLNAHSSIIYNRDYGISDRELWLQGEAYFEVGKQSDHPFRVHTFGLTTTALGTAFNISTMNKADGTIQVSLLEGRIAVSDTLQGGSFRYILQPGEMLEYNEDRRPAAPRPFNSNNVLGWRKYRIIFDNTTLEDAFVLLERRYNCNITIEKGKLAEKKISGVFNANQSVSSILETLGYVHRFTSTYTADGNHYFIKNK